MIPSNRMYEKTDEVAEQLDRLDMLDLAIVIAAAVDRYQSKAGKALTVQCLSQLLTAVKES